MSTRKVACVWLAVVLASSLSACAGSEDAASRAAPASVEAPSDTAVVTVPPTVPQDSGGAADFTIPPRGGRIEMTVTEELDGLWVEVETSHKGCGAFIQGGEVGKVFNQWTLWIGDVEAGDVLFLAFEDFDRMGTEPLSRDPYYVEEYGPPRTFALHCGSGRSAGSVVLHFWFLP